MSDCGAFVCGCSSLTLGDGERRFFAESRPWGFILFRRNLAEAEQARRLADSLRDAVGWDAPILVDQEGGRVARLSPDLCPPCPPARSFGDMARQDPARGEEELSRSVSLMARACAGIGLDVVTLPVLDVSVSGSHDVIGDRAYGEEAELVARLGRVAADALLAEGLLPVAKHVPGHGRAREDSHASLPVVTASWAELESQDFAPFRALAHLPMMMTAHILYAALDEENAATFSERVIGEVIRGHIGFDGLLMSDDVSMGALQGSIGERGRRALAAGCDVVLHCNGGLGEMEELAAAVPVLSGAAERRAGGAIALRGAAK